MDQHDNFPPGSTVNVLAAEEVANVMERPPGYRTLHSDASVNYQLNRWLAQMTPQALPEVVEIARRVNNYDAFTREIPGPW